MGRVNTSETENQSSVLHFSHPHPLHLSNPHQFLSCSACSLEAKSAPVYTCTQCNFCLHKKCFEMPRELTHPFDTAHVLSLLPVPAYPEGLFSCDACGKRGNGFSYNCQPCGIDLHTICASLPTLLAHSSHPHPLSLTFSPPYQGNRFSCDLCRRVGSKNWLYHCTACEFDIHLACITTIPAPQHIPSHSFINQANPMAHNSPVRPPGIEMATYHHLQPHGRPVRPAGNLGSALMNSLVNGLASGASQAATQAIIQGITGENSGGMDGENAEISY
nr:binding protein [Ipomoea batatas]